MKNLRLRDIELGSSDAKHELLNSAHEEENQYLQRFVIPDNVIPEEFLDRKKFFIVGLKGTGKTALLRYLDIQVRLQDSAPHTSFILFKTDFSDDEKDRFGAASNAFMVNNTPEYSKEFDKYLKVWEWFFHRQIVRLAVEDGLDLFEKSDEWKNYVACLTAVKESDKTSFFRNLIPKVKRGNVEVGAAFMGASAKLGLELEWNNETSQIEFSRLLDEAKKWFSKLRPKSGKKLYIFVDELEIALTVSKQYKRDVELVRDLILTVSHLNQQFAKLSIPIYIVTAVRGEVLTAVESTGSEINKHVFDFGLSLRWHQSGGNIKDHPLIKMINRRIQSSERMNGIPQSSDDDIWVKYFPISINTVPAMEYILSRTWHRPRDIVRLLKLAKTHYPNEHSFTHQAFDGTAKDYSTESWTEMSEELSTIYSPNEIKGIKYILQGFESPFIFEDFKTTVQDKSEDYDEVADLIKKHRPAKILHSLYDIGVIGNSGERVRFAHRGDDGLLIDLPMKVIDPLWKYLSIRPRKKCSN